MLHVDIRLKQWCIRGWPRGQMGVEWRGKDVRIETVPSPGLPNGCWQFSRQCPYSRYPARVRPSAERYLTLRTREKVCPLPDWNDLGNEEACRFYGGRTPNHIGRSQLAWFIILCGFIEPDRKIWNWFRWKPLMASQLCHLSPCSGPT